ncbi:MAG: hypothetical protein RLZZ385_1026 [Pseudomonadota bacterium]|jgi:hypothetical protein
MNTHSNPTSPGMQAALEALSVNDLEAVVERIHNSGVLGRSKIYGALLNYLVQCCLAGRQPKEIEIAIEVLGRGAEFDVSQDASVRVNVHQLRKKLENYYKEHEPQARYRLVIPKGQYVLTAMPNDDAADIDSMPVASELRTGTRGAWWQPGLLILVSMLLAGNLVYWVNRQEPGDPVPVSVTDPSAMQPLWRSLFDDELPIMIVTGDYYIFGELNDTGNVARMIREFDINSPRDLEDRIFSDIRNRDNYLDLNLSYIPEGSAFALLRIAPLLQKSGKMVNITMMSDLTTHDIRSNHIVYIGYISALDRLADMTFAASGLQVGRSYDELLNVATGAYYTSDAGLPEDGQQFRDYGLVSTFAASQENQVVVIAGMRDAGLMHTALAVSDPQSLKELHAAAVPEPESLPVSFEALYEVFGVDRMNFSANLIYSKPLDNKAIWGNSVVSYHP